LQRGVYEKRHDTIIVAKEKVGSGIVEKIAKEPSSRIMTTSNGDRHTCTQI
jgi:hypothetical protein